MNEDLKKKLLGSLDVIQKGIEGVWDFSKQEIPQVVKEFLAYNFYSSLIWTIFWIVVITLVIFGFYLVSKSCIKASGNDDEKKFASVAWPTCICIIVCIIPSCAGLKHADDALKIKIAPRVYLLEQVKDMIKETNSSSK